MVSTLIAVPAGYSGYHEHRKVEEYMWPSREVLALTGQAFVDRTYDEALRDDTLDVDECIRETVRISRDTRDSSFAFITCERGWYSSTENAVRYAMIPFIVIFGFGYVVAWVYRGFRPKEA